MTGRPGSLTIPSVSAAPVVAENDTSVEDEAGTRGAHFAKLARFAQLSTSEQTLAVYDLLCTISERLSYVEDFVQHVEELAASAPRLPFGPDFSKIARK